jgi:hypothetical protein
MHWPVFTGQRDALETEALASGVATLCHLHCLCDDGLGLFVGSE